MAAAVANAGVLYCTAFDQRHHPAHLAIRDAVRQLCSRFPDAYFRDVDARRAYPDEFVAALMQAGWLAAMATRMRRTAKVLMVDSLV